MYRNSFISLFIKDIAPIFTLSPTATSNPVAVNVVVAMFYILPKGIERFVESILFIMSSIFITSRHTFFYINYQHYLLLLYTLKYTHLFLFYFPYYRINLKYHNKSSPHH